MSFGFSIGDCLAVSTLAANLYLNYKDAPDDFQELCRVLLTVHTTLGQIQIDADDPRSIISRCSQAQQQELKNIVGYCDETLQQLDRLKEKYSKLDGKTRKISWTRMKYGALNIKEEALVIQRTLLMHLNNISIYLTGIGKYVTLDLVSSIPLIHTVLHCRA